MDVGLARVSSLDQNPQLQLDALSKAGCWPIYEERVSGAAARRPVRDEALRSLKPGDRLTVWKLDRLGRSVIELNDIITDLDRRGVKFRSLTEAIDTSTAQGWLFFQLLAAFAQFERAMIVERTKAGKAARVAAGKHPGGHRLFGTVGAGTKEEVPPEQAARELKLLREAAAHVLSGGSLARLVDEWNRLQIPTKGQRRRGSTRAPRWSETHVRRMLVNPRGAGLFDPPDTHQRLVQLFAPAEERKRLGAPATTLLGGILRCASPTEDGECGAPMYCGREHGERNDPVYRCHRAGSGGRHAGCGKVSVSAAAADRWVTDAVIATACSEKFADALAARRAALLEGDVTAEQLEAWRAEIADLETVLSTRFGTSAHQVQRAELQRLVRQATRRLLQRPDLQELEDLPKSEDKLRQAWDGWDVARRRRVVKLMLERVRVLPATSTGRRFDGRRLDPDWKL